MRNRRIPDDPAVFPPRYLLQSGSRLGDKAALLTTAHGIAVAAAIRRATSRVGSFLCGRWHVASANQSIRRNRSGLARTSGDSQGGTAVPPILGTSSRTSPDVPAQARAFRSPSRGLGVYSGQCAPSGARRDDATGLLSDGLHASRRAPTDSHTRDSRDEGAESFLPRQRAAVASSSVPCRRDEQRQPLFQLGNPPIGLAADAPSPLTDWRDGALSLSERGSILVLGALVACGIATAFGVMSWGRA